MQITPRYEGPPLLTVEPYGWDPDVALLRQRRRLGQVVASLDEAQWAAPSRCDGWTVRDVVVHLNSTNRFFTRSIAQGRAGDPTRFLDGFDPVATPALLVDAAGALGTEDVLAEYLTGTEALAEVLDGMDADSWERVAESPPGHVSLRAVVLHALWDAWIHERDIVLPLALDQPAEPDEIVGALLYAAGLGPAFLAMLGSEREGTLVVLADEAVVTVHLGTSVRACRPTGAFTVGDDALVLEGPAVDLVEALSYRRPHDPPLPPEHAWMLAGLGEVFDQPQG